MQLDEGMIFYHHLLYIFCDRILIALTMSILYIHYVFRLYYQIRKFLQEQNSILPVTKPGLSEHVKNYWIGFLRGDDIFKGSIDTSKQNETNVSQHLKFGYYNRGKIMNIDEGSRLLDVKYLHRREEGGQYVLQIKNNKIPYDHPLLVWYHVDKGVNIPTMIDFFEEISSIGTSEDTDAVDVEALIHSYGGPFKPLLSECIGYFITYKVKDEMVQPIQNIKVKTKFLSGKVVGIDSEKELIAVYYDPKVVIDSNQSSSYRSVWISYNSPHLYWHKNDKLFKAYKKKRALKPKISQNPSLSVKKPININSSVGYKVGIQANEIRTNGEADALYSGVIKYVKVNENKIVVRYDQINNDHHHAKLSSSAVVGGGADSVIDNNNDDVEEFDFDSSLIVWLIAPSSNRPDSIIDTIGYKIELNSNTNPDQIKYPVVFHPGVIISADALTNKVKILFDIQVNQLDNNDDNENNSIDIEEIDWMSDRLTWLYPTSPRFTPEGHVYSDKEVVPRPSNIWRTKGHYVEVKFKNNDLFTDNYNDNDNSNSHNVKELFTNDELYAGQVTEVYSHNRTVKIVYETRLDLDYQPNMEIKEDSEILPWDSEDILWVVHDPSKQRMKNRPIHIKDSKDWLIEVASKEIDAEEDDVYIGRIIAYDERTREVIVRFDSEELDTLDMNIKEHDYEKIHFLSSDIHWLKFAPIQSLSGDRIHFDDAKGWKVEIDSKELDAKDGDVYCGKVVSIDNDHWTVKVQFENDRNDSNNDDDNSNNDDFDDFSFGSPFIHWIEGPKKPLIVKAHQSSLPTSIDDAIGWEVEVEVDSNKDDDHHHHHHHVNLGPGDVYCGRVISINNVDNDVKIKFDGDDNASDDDCEDFPFDSKIIHWIQKSTINIDKKTQLSQSTINAHEKNVNPIVKTDDKHVASKVRADDKHVAVDVPIVKADDKQVAVDLPVVKADDKKVAVDVPIVKADDKKVAVDVPIVKAGVKHEAVDVPIVKADDKHVVVDVPIVKAVDKHVAVDLPIVKADDKQVAVDVPIVKADDKHVVVDALIVKADDKQVAVVAPIVKADDKHVAVDVPIVKADDKQVAVDVPVVKADDKHVAVDVPVVKADDKHVAVDALIVKADDKQVAVDAPIVKADDKHVVVDVPIVKAVDKHVAVDLPIVKADDKQVAVDVPIVKADDKHVVVDALIVKADDKQVAVVAPIVKADDKHVAVDVPIVKADDKQVAVDVPIVKADDKHVAVDTPIVKADDKHVAVEVVPVINVDDLHPSSIEDAVGWIVLVDIDDNSGQLNDAYSGIVVDIDHITQEVKIRFNIDDDEADEDSEYFPYLSTSLHWVEKLLTSSSNDVSDHHDVENAKTNLSNAVDVNNNNVDNNNNNLSVVEIMNKESTNISKLIPSSIDDAVGWEVDIDSTDPDAKPGDVHCGKVISIDRNNGKVRIKFDIDDDNIDDDDDVDDYEDISFNSSTIHWIRHDVT